MNAIAKSMIRQLTPEHGFDLIRIYLGIGLAVRGVLFLMHPAWVGRLLETSPHVQLATQLVALGHILGGALLALGLFTRVAAAVQVIPVFGALVLLHMHDELAGQNQSLEFSALVFVMLLFFACFGAGNWSLDRQRRPSRRLRR
jgi:uncharacterized membrane protein YphA (DoxX/SURF4 family)